MPMPARWSIPLRFRLALGRGAALRGRLARRNAAQDGVVLVLTAILLVVLLGMAALAIDTGGMDQAQTQAQQAADAAALAAADSLPTAGTASTSATTYANDNDPGATVSVQTPYNGSSYEVRVSVTATRSNSFGAILHQPTTTVSAAAVAKAMPQNNCSDPGDQGCYAIFAMDSSSCGILLASHYALTIDQWYDTIVGQIHSNGAVLNNSEFSSFGPSTYSNASPCSFNTLFMFDTFSAGPTAEAPITTWPVDYSTDFPACGSTDDACTGPGGTPSFCTVASTTIWWAPTPTSGNIYCAVGSGTASTPSTWNGNLAIGSAQVGSSGQPMIASYVGGTVYTNASNDNLEACGYSTTGFQSSTCNAPAPALENYPLIYATSGNITSDSANTTLTGDLFAPSGTIADWAIGGSVGFLEGYDVWYEGAFNGDGPSGSGSSEVNSSALLG